jgi:DNA-binding beta-propeller fold protein YncE
LPSTNAVPNAVSGYTLFGCTTESDCTGGIVRKCVKVGDPWPTSVAGFAACASTGEYVPCVRGNLAAAVTDAVGDGTAALVNGIGTSARTAYPDGLTFLSSATMLFIDQHSVRQAAVSTAQAVTQVSLLAGSAAAGDVDATGASARFNYPRGLALSVDGTSLFVSDSMNNKIRKVAISSGDVTTFSGSGSSGSDDGASTSASFNIPAGLAATVSYLYVADSGGNQIRRVATADGSVFTLAGNGNKVTQDGHGTSAEFDKPITLALKSSANALYVGGEACVIRKVDCI